MKFRLVYTERATKEVSKLPAQTKQRIAETLERYSDAPLTYARKMAEPTLGSYRFRIGDYRVIFDIDDESIVILRVGHRREVYRRL